MHYSGALTSGRLCLPIKITRYNGVFYISSKFDGYSGIGKKLS